MTARERLARHLDALGDHLWADLETADRLGNYTPYHLALVRVVSLLDRATVRLR